MIHPMTQIDPNPIRMVSFDLYDTLIELDPPRWDRLSTVLTSTGIDHDPATLMATDLIAEDYWTEINTIQPIRDRDADVQDEIRIEYMQRWLCAAGIEADRELAATVRHAYRAEHDTRVR